MADTSQAEQANDQPQTNGFADDGLDDEERGKMRPADIDADVREMERRKRVEMIMNSRLFREELERIIESQMKEGGTGPGGLLQQLSDMMGPGVGRLQTANMFRSSNCVVPINDIRGVESMGYAKGEKLLRCKLASVYRLIDLYGWTQVIYNHITARLNQDEEQFLVNPWGMLYHEVTASSLVKVDMQGNIVEPGTTNFGVNREGFKLHAAIHSARPDIKCIIHTHTSSVVAVSSLKTGLLPLCHEALVVGEVSTHQYVGGIFDTEEQEKIARNLGPINKVLFLTNHGAVCCGETVEEAFFNVYNTVQACETQMKLMPLGVENLVLLPDDTRKRVLDAARRPPEGHVLDKDKEVTSPTIADRKEKRWRVGGIEFEALMRMLDNAGFRTGYIYRNPLVKGEPPRPRNDIEVPPAVSSLGYLLEEEEWYKQGGWRKFADGRKSHDRTRWLNSPNVYQKVEILETGTPDPKKITKWVDANADEWVADGSPTHSSTPVKINTLQFVPKNTNPKEFKKLQQQIKENRRADKITSGPQSHILEGVSWEEAKKMQDANISQTGDQVILVGAASKGIIQRGFQHNAMVYKAPYAKNPFDTVTEEELEEYKRAVDRKARGEPYDDSESEALSSSAAARPPTGKSPTSPTSETEEESRDEPRVLRIETKQAPRPIQAEVVLSDDSDYPDAVMERSKSARFPQKATPDLVTAPSSIGRSWSLGRSKRSSRVCSSSRLERCPRHYHHPSYVNIPVCRIAARPVNPCSVPRSNPVLEWVTPFELYPHNPSPSTCSSSSESIVGDSLADVASIASCASTAYARRSPPVVQPVESFHVQVAELPQCDRAVFRNGATQGDLDDQDETTVLHGEDAISQDRRPFVYQDGCYVARRVQVLEEGFRLQEEVQERVSVSARNDCSDVDNQIYQCGEERRKSVTNDEVFEGEEITFNEQDDVSNDESASLTSRSDEEATLVGREEDAEVVSSEEETVVDEQIGNIFTLEGLENIPINGDRGKELSAEGANDFSGDRERRFFYTFKELACVAKKDENIVREEETDAEKMCDVDCFKNTVFGEEKEELVFFEEIEESVPLEVEEEAVFFEKEKRTVVSNVNTEEWIPCEETEELVPDDEVTLFEEPAATIEDEDEFESGNNEEEEYVFIENVEESALLEVAEEAVFIEKEQETVASNVNYEEYEETEEFDRDYYFGEPEETVGNEDEFESWRYGCGIYRNDEVGNVSVEEEQICMVAHLEDDAKPVLSQEQIREGTGNTGRHQADDPRFSSNEDYDQLATAVRCEFSPEPYHIFWPNDEKAVTELPPHQEPPLGASHNTGEFFSGDTLYSTTATSKRDEDLPRPASPAKNSLNPPLLTTDCCDPDSLSSDETYHFGQGSLKTVASFWETGSLPCFSPDRLGNFSDSKDGRPGYDDTESVKSWTDGNQCLPEQMEESPNELNSTLESTDNELEWSGAFTKDNTYDECEWTSGRRKRRVSLGTFEGGGEELYELPDPPAAAAKFGHTPPDSDTTSTDGEFFSPISTMPSMRQSSESDTPYESAKTTLNRTEERSSCKTRRRSNSLDASRPTNAFQFSWGSSESMPEVQVTQTVSVTGLLSSKRVNVETTFVSLKNKEGKRCLTTRVSCTSAGEVEGHLYEDKKDYSSPLELGRLFTLKGRRNGRHL